ncbi:thiamine pyrophosphate-binding protein [Nocardioides nitrophenolicus]|uniref:thiamine pyrophosphate-binding protein n=1 Tax=Nocardioides nitrophenolicus TaxID=60489 RepID=UPI001958B6C4|nr:thiamine pyrophosphate-binding protein [Nocardioides nitrophenolicus]MBM7518763.1 thiamine pyrophosphate-dependent acetolactate synthase large subunit-like protein [Nocardioides nitrophenolicus]
MQAHERVALALRELGVERIFGLMGEGNLRPLIDFDRLGGVVVAATTEGAAVSMADGYARVGRRLGVASVTHGPGATNALTALTEAVRARTPLLLLTGDTPPRDDHLQRFDLRGLAGLAGAGYLRVGAAADAAADVARAVHRAQRECRPVVLDLPVPLQRIDVADGPPVRLVPPPRPGVPDEDELDRALGVLAGARRPVVLAGRGALDAREEIRDLGRILGAPLGTTLLGKCLFAGEPLDLGVVGTLATDVALETVQAADCLLVLGAGLNRYTTVDGALVRGRPVVQVDRDPARISTAAEVGLVGDVRRTVVAMREQLTAAEHRPATAHRADLDRLLRAAAERPVAGADGPDTLDPRPVMRWLDRVLPAERVVVTDTGRFVYAPWRLLSVGSPERFAHTCGFASIGLGLGTALGAAVGSGRPTVAVLGDGGAVMSLVELATAVRLGLPLLVVVCNDGAYGMEYRHLRLDGEDPAPARRAWPDLAEVARALGARAATVRTRADLELVAAQVAGLGADGAGPLLLDVRCDPDVDVADPG